MTSRDCGPSRLVAALAIVAAPAMAQNAPTKPKFDDLRVRPGSTSATRSTGSTPTGTTCMRPTKLPAFENEFGHRRQLRS